MSDVTFYKLLNAYAEELITPAQTDVPASDMVENIVEKRRKCWLPAFSHFPHNILSKAIIKTLYCVVLLVQNIVATQ